MNATYLKLALALLWLVPGIGLLVNDIVTGRVTGFRVLGHQVAFAWVFLAFGVVNLVRWYLSRSRRSAVAEWDTHRRRRHRPAEPTEPNPDFDFSDPSSPER